MRPPRRPGALALAERRRARSRAFAERAEAACGGALCRLAYRLGAALWRAWIEFSTALAVLLDGAFTVLGWLVGAAEWLLVWPLGALLWPLAALFCVPYLGRGLRWLWSLGLTALWGLAALPGVALGLLGVLPEKRLRVAVLVLAGEDGRPVAKVEAVVRALREAVEIFAAAANVRLVPAQALAGGTAFDPSPEPDASWVQVLEAPAARSARVVGCDLRAALDDLGRTGAQLEWLAATKAFRTTLRRVLGYGAPVLVMVVERVEAGEGRRLIGCSLGPLADYVTVEGRLPVCLAHELGHACNLWHLGRPGNLMNPTCGGRDLTAWQVALLRASRHVTFL